MKNKFFLYTSTAILLGIGAFGCTKGAIRTDVGVKLTEAKPEAPVTEAPAPQPVEAPKAEAPAKAQAPPPAAKEIADVFFDYDRYAIRDDAQKVLEENARIFKDNGVKITIEGHCDERGTDEYNIALGAKRVASVKRFLTDMGVEPGRISTISYGSEKPFCREHNERCWQRNRTAHFVTKE